MSCIYGTRQFGFEDQGWIAHLTISTLLDRPITIYGDGKQVRDVLYVEDLLRAYDAFVASRLTRGVFNIGGGPAHTTSLGELLDALEQATGKRSPITHRTWRPSDQKVYITDLSHIRQMIGWEPRVSFHDGLRRLAEWVSTNRELF
jgi:CDP-paratose 2-epimerase